jgi:outer membrane protein TolC
VLTAETSWRNVRTQLTNAQATLMQRSVQVFRTLGGGWSPDRPAAASPEAETVASVVEGMK